VSAEPRARPGQIEGFPRERLLELLRQARPMITGTDRQQALLEDLRIPPHAVAGWVGGEESPVPEHRSGDKPLHAITAPALPSSPAVGPAPEQEGSDGDGPPARPEGAGSSQERDDYLDSQQPAPAKAGPASGGDLAGPSRPGSRSMVARRFAEALLDVVSTPEYLDASIILGRRAQSELPPAQRPEWAQLLDELERLQVENRRRSLAQGQSPDLASLTDWAGFECLHHYSLTDRFFGREEYLTRLDQWVADPGSASVLCLTALGGAGKSALAWRWLNGALTRLRQDGYRGALWCSFYEGTFKFENFLRRALAFCGRMQTEGVDTLSRGQVEDQLVEALARDRYVLVIDGLERLMTGYAQTAERAIDDEGTRGASSREEATPEERRMEDRRDGAFFARLATPLASRLLITTRLAPADLEHRRSGELRPHVSLVNLRGLDRGDAVELWNSIIPDSPVDGEIAGVLEACDYHPLAISILARSVAVRGTGWAGWRQAEAHRDFAPFVGPTARVRAHIIGLCQRDLDPEAEDLLNLLAVSGKPMQIDEIEEALRQHSIASGEERWTLPGRVQSELRAVIDLGFVGEAVVEGRAEYDLHPVVRGVVWRAMTDPARTPDRSRFLDQAMSELTAVPDPQLAIGPVYLQKAAAIFEVLVSTGQSDRAWEMFQYKLWAPLYLKGAYRELLDLFEQLLPRRDPLQLLPLRSRRDQADAAEALAGLMMTGGDPVVADHLMVWCGVIRLRLNDGLGFLDVRRSQTWQSLYQGRLFDTELGLRQVKVQAGFMGVGGLFSTVNPWIGLELALRGQAEEARQYLVIDDNDVPNRRWWVQGVAEGHLYLGDHARALELLDRLPEDEEEYVEPTQEAWELLTRGMAEVGVDELDQAEEHLNAALSIARRTGYRIIQCFALVSLAELAVARARWRDAEDRVGEYFQVDEASGYRLTAGEAWRLRALCAEERGDLDEALNLAARAYQICACDGPPFMHAAGARRARELLGRLGGYVPRTSSRLRPTWHAELERVRAEEAEVDAMAQHSGSHVILIRDEMSDRQQLLRMNNLVYLASEDDRSWWTLVAGTNPTLTQPVRSAMLDLEISIAELRQLFESSAEKSLEVVFYRLHADRVLEPDRPTPFGGLGPAERTRWLSRVDEHEIALEEFLRSDLAVSTAGPFRHQGLDAQGVEAFSLDGRRRIQVDQASADARRWWTQLEERRKPWDMLILAECIQSALATLDEFLDAVSVTGTRGFEYGFLSLREKQAIAGLQVAAVSRTDSWSAFDVLLRLQTVKYQLGWLELTESVRAFWTGIEERNAQRPGPVLQLAEELALRGSSIRQYHEASLRSSDPEDPRATLAYLDYLRLAATPWQGKTWPDDVSVERWSYDTASPTFRNVSSWTGEQIARWLELIRDRIGYPQAPDRAREWWDALTSTTDGATMVRLAEELEARTASVAEFYRAHIDAASDNLLAVLSYLDFSLIAKKRLSEDESIRAERELASGHEYFRRKTFDKAAEAYEAAIAANPRIESAYLYLAFSLEELGADESAEARQPAEVLRRGIEFCHDSSSLELELRRFTLCLPPYQPPDLRSIHVELSEPLVEDVDSLLPRVEAVREVVRRTVGVPFPGLWFRQNDGLEPPGAYRILIDEIQVADGTTVRGQLYRLAPGVEEQPVWPTATRQPQGEWQEDDGASPHTGLTPYDYLLRHLRVELAGVAAQVISEEMVLTLVEEGWSTLDPSVDLPLLSAFTEVLRTLLDDQIPITEADVILDWYRPLYEAGVVLEEAVARLRLLPDIRDRLPGNRDRDVLLHLEPSVEQQFAGHAVANEASGVLFIPPRVMHAVLEEMRSLLAWPSDRAGDPVLVVRAAEFRRAIRQLLRFEFPAVPVVAEAELLPRDAP